MIKGVSDFAFSFELTDNEESVFNKNYENILENNENLSEVTNEDEIFLKYELNNEIFVEKSDLLNDDADDLFSVKFKNIFFGNSKFNHIGCYIHKLQLILKNSFNKNDFFHVGPFQNSVQYTDISLFTSTRSIL